jgi:putative transposase
MLYSFIQQMESQFPLQLLCEVFHISRSAYYAYKAGNTYQPTYQQVYELAEVKKAFRLHKRRYGTRRLVTELQETGLEIGRKKVRSLMNKQDLVAIQPKSFVPRTTDLAHPELSEVHSRHGKRVAPNLLLGVCAPTAPNLVWVGDITYLPLRQGKWAYLATWLDLFSRTIVGWQVDNNMEEDLIINALQKACNYRKPVAGLIVHSDRGGQYVANNFKKLLDKYECKQSMSPADDPYDNAFAESFFSRLKAETLENGAFLSIEDARTEVFEFIEMYYNTIRRHSALGNKSPLNFEKIYYQNNSLNLQ